MRFSTKIAVYLGNGARWNVNRKSWVVHLFVSVPMTLSDPNLGFKITVYLQVEYVIGTKLL